jgi:hypothetical protein
LIAMEHTFHTRHDFTPELGWAAFQLLAELGAEGTTPDGLEAAARVLASPLARRADLRKLLLSLEELGLARREGDSLTLSVAGRALAASAGRYEAGFNAGVHCLYYWRWLWDGRQTLATPSWSYRQVCREIRLAGPMGIEPDAVVLKVAAAGERFGVERVSFSRSSVNGVTGWLKAQVPPLVDPAGGRLCPVHHPRPGLTVLRFQVAALCALHDGDTGIETEAVEQLADALVLAPQELRWVLAEFLGPSDEFSVLGGGKRIIYRGSSDSFVEWIVHGRHDES